ncbi:MAG: enoyl-CoA hydratase-related protein [Pseudomonadota bacterium]
MSEWNALSVERHQEHVAEIVLIGPGHGNAMGPDFWRELPPVVRELNADESLRCLIMRGGGEHFTYGLDLPGMAQTMGNLIQGGASGRVDIVQTASHMVEGLDALATGRLPVIAAVHGWCIGAGIEMIAACDIRLASQTARLALREVKVGIVPDLGGIQRLPHIIGEGWARELALTGDDFTADRAREIGLFTHVFDDDAALFAAARDQAARIAANPPLVTAGIKQVMNGRIQSQISQANHAAATLNGLLMQSEDFAEAMQAFMEKREPTFKGR